MGFMATYNSVKYKSFSELLLIRSTQLPNWILLEMKEPANNKELLKLLQEVNEMKILVSYFISNFSLAAYWPFFYNEDLSS